MRVRPAVSTAVLTALILTLPVAASAVPAAAAPHAAPTAASAGGDATVPAAFVPVGITRVLDTRIARETPAMWARPLQPGESFDAPLSTWTSHPPHELPFVPADATAVVVNVTATDTTADGYLTVRRDGDKPGQPATSTLNFKAGETVSNTISVAVNPRSGTSPMINIYNNAGTTDVVVDVLGYYRPGAADKYQPTRQTRLLDTRTEGGPLGWGNIVSPKVAQAELGTADAKAVVLNVTAVNPTSNGFITAYPSGTPLPSAGSNLNYAPGRTIANQVVVPVGADGKVSIFNAGNTQLIVDIVGYYGPSGHQLYSAVTEQTRLLDTRVGGASPAFSTRRLPVAGVAGVPGTAMTATLNVTVTEPAASGHLEVLPAGWARTGTSTLNFTPGMTVANGATTELNDVPGGVDLFNHSAGSTQLIADLTGYFTAG